MFRRFLFCRYINMNMSMKMFPESSVKHLYDNSNLPFASPDSSPCALSEALCAGDGGDGRGYETLLRWCKMIVAPYSLLHSIENFTTSWKDGLLFCAIISRFRPDLMYIHIRYTNMSCVLLPFCSFSISIDLFLLLFQRLCVSSTTKHSVRKHDQSDRDHALRFGPRRADHTRTLPQARHSRQAQRAASTRQAAQSLSQSENDRFAKRHVFLNCFSKLHTHKNCFEIDR